MTQPVTLEKAASYGNGPASQERLSIFKGRVYLGKKSIGLLNRQVERAIGPRAPQDKSKGIIQS